MSKHKVSELEGLLLDMAAARAEGWRVSPVDHTVWLPPAGFNIRLTADDYGWRPSRNWEHGGPIIEREHGQIVPPNHYQSGWFASMGLTEMRYRSAGPTPLIAAMRAYVASKFGPEVDLP